MTMPTLLGANLLPTQNDVATVATPMWFFDEVIEKHAKRIAADLRLRQGGEVSG
jgi:hypothetical protein